MFPFIINSEMKLYCRAQIRNFFKFDHLLIFHSFLGCSILLGDLFRRIPYSVLFGVFIYIGLSSLTAIQLFLRCQLLCMPAKHHPDVSFVKSVRLFYILICFYLIFVFLIVEKILAWNIFSSLL